MKRLFLFLFLFATVSGCAEGRDPVCKDADCRHPPDDTCVDAQTLREFNPQGSCNPDTGKCVYGHQDRRCEADGCQDGACVGEDMCEGVTCDQPPPSRCRDETTFVEYDSPGTCDPQTGRCSYKESHRTCPDGCLQNTCVDLGGDFGILIPAGTRACSDKRSSWDVFGGYRHRMRVSFRDGVVRLPRDEPEFQRDWIAAIEYGPDRTVLEPAGQGGFSRTSSADRVVYEFEQEFTSGGDFFTLMVSVRFDPSPDSVLDRLRVFDESYLSPPASFDSLALDLRVSRETNDTWYFTTCRYTLYQPVWHKVQTADGGDLELDERYFPSDACMLGCPTALAGATWRWSQEERVVVDVFRLAFVDGQHNWFEQFLVVFDDPIGSIHGLYYFPADSEVPEKVVHYLDEHLNRAGSSVVTSHDIFELAYPFDAQAVAASTCMQYCHDIYGLSDACDASCPVEGEPLAGRCLPSADTSAADWTALDACDSDFDSCVQAGRPFIQCCCSLSSD